MIPRNELEPIDDFDNLLDALLEEYFMYVGSETCECGHHHVVFAPIERVISECLCGLLLDMNLEEHDG